MFWGCMLVVPDEETAEKTKQEQSGQHRDQCDVTFTVYLQSDCEETGLAW